MHPIEGRLPSKVVLCQRSSSVKGCQPSKVVIRQRFSSVKGRLPSKVVFCQRSSSVKGRLLSKVVFRQRSSSVKDCRPSKVFFRQRIFHLTLFNLVWLSYWVWHSSAQSFIFLFFEPVPLNDLHCFSLRAGPPQWPQWRSCVTSALRSLGWPPQRDK